MRTARGLSVDPAATCTTRSSHPRLAVAERFWRHVTKSDGCWLWTRRCNDKGYGAFGLAGGKSQLAHRVAWALTYGPIPERALVLHSPMCTSRACVRPDHLRLGNQKDNVKDTMSLGRAHCQQGPPAWIGHPEMHARGERNGGAKLSPQQVIEARRVYAAGGVTMKELAKRVGISPSQMHRILNGHSWDSLRLKGRTESEP